MKKGILLGVITSLSVMAMAQDASDAIRFSQTSFGGTARNLSMAGSFGALGAEFGSISINPAGLGVYKNAELVFSTSLANVNVVTNHYGTPTTDFKYNFNLSNLGLVGVVPNYNDSSKWKNVNTAFGFNRLKSFHTTATYQGINNESSLIDVFLNDANKNNGLPPNSLDKFGSNLAYETYLISPKKTGGYYSAIPSGGTQQTITKEERGRINEMVIAFAGNYDNRLYIGGSIGVPFLLYEKTVTHNEKDIMDTMPKFNEFTYVNKLSTNGVGINLKVGAIYKLHEMVRLGAAIHTPSFMTLNDQYSGSMSSNTLKTDTNYFGNFRFDSPQGSFEYDLATPFKAIGSVGFVLGKLAVLNIDYEFVDYKMTRLSSTDYSFTNENRAINTKYVSANNIKAGGEIRFLPFIFRGGYAVYGDPTGKTIGNTSLTMGVGYREDNFYLDFGYGKTTSTEDVYVYNSSLVKASSTNTSNNVFMATMGFKF